MHFSGRSSARYLIVDITISTQKIVAGRHMIIYAYWRFEHARNAGLPYENYEMH